MKKQMTNFKIISMLIIGLRINLERKRYTERELTEYLKNYSNILQQSRGKIGKTRTGKRLSSSASFDKRK